MLFRHCMVVCVRVARALFSALAPPLTPEDEKVVQSIRKLLAFFLGENDVAPADGNAASMNSNNPALLAALAPNAPDLAQARALLPVLQENQAEMRAFGLQIVGRLTDLQTARAIGFLRQRVAAI